LFSLQRPPVFPVAALLLVLPLFGCTSMQKGSWQDDRELVMKSLEDAHLKIAELNKHIENQDSRVLELQKTVTQQQARIEALTAGQIASKQRRTTAATHAARSPSKPPKNAAELARQLDRIANNIETTMANDKAQSGSNVTNEERDTYTAAYLAFKSNKFDESIVTFRALLAKYPEGEYSDQAYYWLGEGLLAQHKHKEAASAFGAVVKDYPDSSKHAMAQLRLAVCYNELKRTRDARKMLQQLMRKHPNTPAAEQGRLFLDQLSGNPK